MNYLKRTALVIGLLGIISSGLVACGGSKGNSSSNVVGNVAVNGSTVTSTDTVNGVSIAASISNLTMYSNSYYNYGGNSGGASFMLTVNNSSQQVTASNINTGNWAQTSVGGQYVVYSTSEMIDSTDVALVVMITSYYGNNSGCSQYKQMGMIQNTSTGAIRSVSEQVGYGSSCGGLTPILPSATALIAQLQSIMI
jgi:hypothetical protein